MKTLLIVFAILLLLLTLLSTFGGSIRPNENFQQKEEEETTPMPSGQFFYDTNKLAYSENFAEQDEKDPLELSSPPPPASLPSVQPTADGFAIEPFEMEEPMYASF